MLMQCLCKGDALSVHVGMKFSTIDQDNDGWLTGDCAGSFKAGWWYQECIQSNLNGLYLKGKTSEANWGSHCVVWKPWKGDYYSLKFVEMKLRPYNN